MTKTLQLKILLFLLLCYIQFWLLPHYYPSANEQLKLPFAELNASYREFVRLYEQDKLKSEYVEAFNSARQNNWIINEFEPLKLIWLDRLLAFDKQFDITNLQVKFLNQIMPIQQLSTTPNTQKYKINQVFFPIQISFNAHTPQQILQITKQIGADNNILFNNCSMVRNKQKVQYVINFYCVLYLPKIILPNIILTDTKTKP